MSRGATAMIGRDIYLVSFNQNISKNDKFYPLIIFQFIKVEGCARLQKCKGIVCLISCTVCLKHDIMNIIDIVQLKVLG